MTAGDPKVTLDLAQSHGLTAEEYDRIIRRLGREPTFTELGLFSALWSEHCAYKHSRVFLRALPTRAHEPFAQDGSIADPVLGATYGDQGTASGSRQHGFRRHRRYPAQLEYAGPITRSATAGFWWPDTGKLDRISGVA